MTTRGERNTADAAAQAGREQRFEGVQDSFVQLYAKPKNLRWEDTRRILTFDALPVWRERPVSSIDCRDVVQLMDQVSARSPSAARALFAQLRRMFAWCVDGGLIVNEPINNAFACSRQSEELLAGGMVQVGAAAGADSPDRPQAHRLKVAFLTPAASQGAAHRRRSEGQLTEDSVRTKNFS